jgi:hypothetical protein
MLERRHGREAARAWARANETVERRAGDFEADLLAGRFQPVYKFDHQVLQPEDVHLGGEQLHLGSAARVSLALDNPYQDMC